METANISYGPFSMMEMRKKTKDFKKMLPSDNQALCFSHCQASALYVVFFPLKKIVTDLAVRRR